MEVKPKFVPRPPESPEVIEARWRKKKERAREMANGVRRLRVNVSRDLKSDDEKEFLTALVISIMLETAERVGNDESAGNGHLGVTGFKKKNISVSGNSVSLSYTGKSGVEHEKKFTDEKIAKALKRAIKNSPSKYVFETSDGFRIKADRVNRYLSEFSITAKDIRGFMANKYTIDKLKGIEPEENDKKRKKQLNKVLKSVAEKVGHGRPTLKKHYLIPELWDTWIDEGKIIDISDLGYMEKGGEVEKGAERDSDKIIRAILYVYYSRRPRLEPEFESESYKHEKKSTPNSFSVKEIGGTTSAKKKWKATDIIAYDERGDIVGLLSISQTEPVGAFKITVREDAMRKGWAKKLLDKAEGLGFDMVGYMGVNNFTHAGRWSVISWLKSKLSPDEFKKAQKEYSWLKKEDGGAIEEGACDASMRLRDISPEIQILEVVSSDKRNVAKVFVRPQVHYDNKHFKGKIFTLDEFKDWYNKNYSKSEDFTYYNDWNGFNVPDYAIKKFINGEFCPLTNAERWLLDNIQSSGVDLQKPFYLIGYEEGDEPTKNHERAHALYYLSPEYKKKADRIVGSIPDGELSELNEFLKVRKYHPSVFADEMQAYLMADKEYLQKYNGWNPAYEKYHKALVGEFNKYFGFSKEGELNKFFHYYSEGFLVF